MTKIKVNFIIKNLSHIEELITEIKKIRPDFSDEDAMNIIMAILKE